MGSTMGYAAGEYSAGIGGYCSLKNWDKSIGIIIPARTLAFFSKSFNWVSLTHIVFSSKAYFFLVLMVSTPLKNMSSSESVGIITYIYIYGKHVPNHQAVLRFQHVPTGRNTNGSPVGQPRDDQTCHICRWSPSLHPPRGMANLWFKRWSSVGFLR